MSVNEAMDVFARGFQILASKVSGKYPAVRFIAPPYTEEGSSCMVQTDPRNPDHIGGVVILGVLAKFKLEEQDFKAAYNEVHQSRQRRA